jgi:hypothetical protein
MIPPPLMDTGPESCNSSLVALVLLTCLGLLVVPGLFRKRKELIGGRYNAVLASGW